MKRMTLILAIAIILVSNGIALIGVSQNRAGEPVQTIELTERELPLQNVGQDNSGIDLKLNWTRPGSLFVDAALNRARLEEVGFNFQVPAGKSGKDLALLPRVAYVALEYGGQAWEQYLQWTENEKQRSQTAPRGSVNAPNPERDRISKSRLCLVDASRSMSELRRRYPDQSKYLVVRAVLMARLEEVKDPQSGAGISPSGFVSEILPDFIHVPLPQGKLLSPLKPQTGQEPRYAVTLKYGRNLEPWVVSVRLLSNPNKN
jgi:hypothetical protein